MAGGDERETSVEALVGREDDVHFIASFVAGISWAGSALLLVGEPGVGKSALLDEAAQLAAGRGFRVLRAAGVEFEADVGFSALNQLLHPLFEDLDTLERWQREALTTALGLGPGPQSDDLVLANAMLALLTHAATRSAVLLVVDDLPWLDRASARALAFASRRLGHTRVGLIAASRSDEDNVLSRAALPTLSVEPLTDRSAAELLAMRYPAMSPRGRRRLLAEAQGNPLALLELPAALHTVEQYANNPIEADHGRLKARLRPMRGLKRHRSAGTIAAGHAFDQNLRRGHYDIATDVPDKHRLRAAFDDLAAVA